MYMICYEEVCSHQHCCCFLIASHSQTVPVDDVCREIVEKWMKKTEQEKAQKEAERKAGECMLVLARHRQLLNGVVPSSSCYV